MSDPNHGRSTHRTSDAPREAWGRRPGSWSSRFRTGSRSGSWVASTSSSTPGCRCRAARSPSGRTRSSRVMPSKSGFRLPSGGLVRDPARTSCTRCPWAPSCRSAVPGASISSGPRRLPARPLVFATDTGMTAALGLIRGTQFQPLSAPDPRRLVRRVEGLFPSRIMARHGRPRGSAAGSRSGPGRRSTIPKRAAGRDALQAVLADGRPDRVFLSGDGAVLYPLCQDLVESGLDEGRIRLECFFNNPQRKAP